MNCRIRDVEDRDWEAICRLGREFYAEGNLPGLFLPAVFEQNWRKWLELDLAVLIVLECDRALAGVIGAIVNEDACDGAKVAQEMFWFVSKAARGHGLRLLDALEMTMRGLGVRRLTMAHLTGLRARALAALFARKGFAPVETHYVKTLEA